jgi:hypothetical protein
MSVDTELKAPQMYGQNTVTKFLPGQSFDVVKHCCESVTYCHGSVDPWIRITDFQIQIQILLFSSGTFKMLTTEICFAFYSLKVTAS